METAPEEELRPFQGNIPVSWIGDPLSSVSSTDDNHRIEMLWTSKMSTTLERWSLEVKQTAALHKLAAKKKKRIYKALGVASGTIVLAIGTLMPYFEHPLTFAIILAFASCLSFLNTTMDFGGATQRHLSAENELGKLFLKMDYIMSQPKKDRAAADVTMTELRHCITEIDAPDV